MQLFALSVLCLAPLTQCTSPLPAELLAKFATPEKDPHGVEYDNEQPRNRFHKRYIDRHGHPDLHFLVEVTDSLTTRSRSTLNLGRTGSRTHTHCASARRATPFTRTSTKVSPTAIEAVPYTVHTALDRDGDGEISPTELFSLALGLGYNFGDEPYEQHARIGYFRAI